MKATHFGAGNIGRGFIGEVLADNNFFIEFVDINEKIINALINRGEYHIGLAHEGRDTIHITNVTGINNAKNPEAAINSVATSDIVTTAIGPNVIPFIVELIAKGIRKRRKKGNETPIDIIACENMIGGSEFLYSKMEAFLTEEDKAYIEEYVGFPNAAVDRIVPIQSPKDPLFVSVEPFKEWIIENKNRKATQIELNSVHYVEDLKPYIERKLFSVNTGHATVAYSGMYAGYTTVDEALKDEGILQTLKDVLDETGTLLIDKWHFDEEQHDAYKKKIVERFINPFISDELTRVGRTPIRKLGYNERFIRPIRELRERGFSYKTLLAVVGKILCYENIGDDQSMELKKRKEQEPLDVVLKDITGLDDNTLIAEIIGAYHAVKR